MRVLVWLAVGFWVGFVTGMLAFVLVSVVPSLPDGADTPEMGVGWLLGWGAFFVWRWRRSLEEPQPSYGTGSTAAEQHDWTKFQ